MPHRTFPEAFDSFGVPVPRDAMLAAVGAFWFRDPDDPHDIYFVFIDRGDDQLPDGTPLQGFVSGSFKDPQDATDPARCLAREVAEELTTRNGPLLPEMTAGRLMACPILHQVDPMAAVIDGHKGYKNVWSWVFVCELQDHEIAVIRKAAQLSAASPQFRDELMAATGGETWGVRVVSARGVLARLNQPDGQLRFVYERIDTPIAYHLAAAALGEPTALVCRRSLRFTLA